MKIHLLHVHTRLCVGCHLECKHDVACKRRSYAIRCVLGFQTANSGHPRCANEIPFCMNVTSRNFFLGEMPIICDGV